MKKILLLGCLGALMLLFSVSARAQQPAVIDSACPGLNPLELTTSFIVTDVRTDADFQMNVPKRYYYSGTNGIKPSGYSNYFCYLTGATGCNMGTDMINEAAMATAPAVSTGTSYCQGMLDQNRKFRIMHSTDGPGTGGNVGKVPETAYRLSYCPPGALDKNGRPITQSIRVGHCLENVGDVTRLNYTMYVTPDNALLIIHYAVVSYAAGHGSGGDPGFIIRVTNANGVQLSDTLSYMISSTPVSYTGSNSDPTGCCVPSVVIQTNPNTPGWHSINNTAGTNQYWWKDWDKVAIDLSGYLFQTVRLEVYSMECGGHAHPAWAYIAGECQSMVLTSSGCAAGESTEVTTIAAPKGLRSYTWYKSLTGPYPYTGSVNGIFRQEGLADMTVVSDNVDLWNACRVQSSAPGLMTRTSAGDTCYWRPLPGDSAIYLATADDFIPEAGTRRGQAQYYQAFFCKTTSLMCTDTNKKIKSYIPTLLTNSKPTAAFLQYPNCMRQVHIVNNSSTASPQEQILDEQNGNGDSVLWTIYDHDNTTVLGTRTGHEFDYTFPEPGIYNVKVHVRTSDTATSPVCYSEKRSRVTVYDSPVARISVTPTDNPCVDSTITLIDGTSEWGTTSGGPETSWRRMWYRHNGDSLVAEGANNEALALQSIQQAFHGDDTVMLIVRNGTQYSTGSAYVYCADTAYKAISVFRNLHLVISDDTIVCRGSQTNVTVYVDSVGPAPVDPSIPFRYDWYPMLYGSTPVQANSPVLQVTPPSGVDDVTYYVKVTSPQGCTEWGSVNLHIVNPEMTHDKDSVCPGQPVKLQASGAHHYTWSASPNDATLAGHTEDSIITVRPQTTTTYTLIGHGSDDCNASPLTHKVTVIAPPTPTIVFDPPFIDSEDPTVAFQDLSPRSVASYWNFGNNATSNEPKTSYTFTDIKQDSLCVTLRTTNVLGCSSFDTVCIPVELFTVWAPNIFTPNLQDNNVFRIYTANQLEYFSMRIFNRQGHLVFSSSDPESGWDGTYNGVRCPQGVYVYQYNYRRPGTTDIVRRQGTLTLVR